MSISGRVRLSVRMHGIACLRWFGGGYDPDPVDAAVLAEMAGADGIVLSLTHDDELLWKRDLPLLGAVVKTVFSIEIPHGLGDLDHLFEYDPQILTLIPTLSNHEGTTAEGVDGGLDVAGSPTVYAGVFKRMRQAGVAPSVLIDADVEQVSAARDVGGERVLLYTGGYARVGPQGDPGELARIEEASIAAVELGLSVAAGGGLTRRNLPDLLSIPMIDEVVIGHAIMARAMFIGFENAVQEILDLMPRGAEEP